MKLTRRLIPFFAVPLLLATSTYAQTIVYDNFSTPANAGYGEVNSDNPIFGDALNLTQAGDLTGMRYVIWNLPDSAGNIVTCTTRISIYDNTSPYTGFGSVSSVLPLIAGFDVPWDFSGINVTGFPPGLPPGYYVRLTLDFTVLPTPVPIPANILITQQFIPGTGPADENGMVAFGDPTVGASPTWLYIESSSTPPGLYVLTTGSGGPNFGQVAYQISVNPSSSGGNHQPVADPQSLTIQQDTPLNLTLTGSDLDNDPLTFAIGNNPVHGTLSGTPPNITYQPNAGFVGSDSFTFTVNDTHTDSVPATVSITLIPPPNGLVITPTWDSTILNDPAANQIINTINSAIQVYEYKFRDPINVHITFAETNVGLGMNTTFSGPITYSTFVSKLTADSKSAADTTALAHIPGGTVNPVDGSSQINVTTANARAIGISANPPPGQPDSVIFLNMPLLNPTRASVDPNRYDLRSTVSHEIDEVLGTPSGLGLGTTFPSDLFRYSSTPGVRNFTPAGDDAWFSIDGGTTRLVQYNQDPNGDYGDWWSIGGTQTPRVQDAFALPAAMPNLGIELTVLDVIGYDPTPAGAAPSFQSVTRNGNTITFTWSALYGRSYQVQSNPNVSQNTWSNLGLPVVANGPTASFSDTIGPAPNNFYRVALLPPPNVPAPPVDPNQDQNAFIGPMITQTRILWPAPKKTPTSLPSSPVKLVPGDVKPTSIQRIR